MPSSVTSLSKAAKHLNPPTTFHLRCTQSSSKRPRPGLETQTVPKFKVIPMPKLGSPKTAPEIVLSDRASNRALFPISVSFQASPKP